MVTCRATRHSGAPLSGKSPAWLVCIKRHAWQCCLGCRPSAILGPPASFSAVHDTAAQVCPVVQTSQPASRDASGAGGSTCEGRQRSQPLGTAFEPSTGNFGQSSAQEVRPYAIASTRTQCCAARTVSVVLMMAPKTRASTKVSPYEKPIAPPPHIMSPTVAVDTTVP